jgi:hypothetical protein
LAFGQVCGAAGGVSEGWKSADFQSAIPDGQVAQLVEQRTENPRVGGSIPLLATISLWTSDSLVVPKSIKIKDLLYVIHRWLVAFKILAFGWAGSILYGGLSGVNSCNYSGIPSRNDTRVGFEGDSTLLYLSERNLMNNKSDTQNDKTQEAKQALTGAKRQHFLHKFYLEGFTKDGMVAVFDRESNEVRIQNPINTGVIGHFYTLEDAEGRKRFELELGLIYPYSWHLLHFAPPILSIH